MLHNVAKWWYSRVDSSPYRATNESEDFLRNPFVNPGWSFLTDDKTTVTVVVNLAQNINFDVNQA